jgi:hypothetical protein
MKMFRNMAVAALAISGCLLTLEMLFRVLPVSTATLMGYHHDPDLLTYPANHEWTVSTGWDLRNAQSLHSNASGFAADQDFVRDTRAVALIGDSYVEASALPAHSRPAAQLQRLLADGRAVYAMGTPGTTLLDYAQRVRWASQQFGTRDFVLWLEAGDLRQVLCGSGNIVSRCLDPVTLAPRIERWPAPDATKRLLRHSALAQYIFGQLKFNPARVWAELQHLKAPAHRATSPTETATQKLRAKALAQAAVQEFLAQLQPYPIRRLMLAVDGHHDGTAPGDSAIDGERQALIEQLQAAGLEVLDLQPIYARHRAASRLSPEVGPYDHHLNALGVEMVMRAVATRFKP